jgi:hypothetical protein
VSGWQADPEMVAAAIAGAMSGPAKPYAEGYDAGYRDAAREVEAHVRRLVADRLREIGDGHGCEAGAARAFERGRLAVVDGDLWDALGLPRPTL